MSRVLRDVISLRKRNDHRLDAVARDASTADFEINDSYYDHTDAGTDLNCVNEDGVDILLAAPA